MTALLQELIGKISITNSRFSDARNKDIADEIYRRHTLQSVVESLSDLKTKRANKSHNVSVDSADSISYLDKVHVLIECSTDQWILSFAKGFYNSDTLSLCTGSLRTIVRTATEQFDKEKVYVFEENDFTDVKWRAECCLRILNSLFSKLKLANEKNEFPKCFGQVILFSMQIIAQHLHTNLWTSDESNMVSESFLQEIMSHFGYSAAKDILVMDVTCQPTDQTSFRNSVFGRQLVEWKPLLLKDSWKQNPMTVTAFIFCLQQMTFPHLSDFIECVLPPSLLFLDDYMTRNKLTGIQCIVHIIENSSAEELRWYGRADVIFEALKHQLYSTEESLLQQSLPALLKILKVIVKPSLNMSSSTKYDEILQMILQTAVHENKLVLRRTQTEHLQSLFEMMGIGVVKHLKNILDLVVEYLDIPDTPTEQSRFNILKALNTLILIAWPRIRCHGYILIRSLIKMIHDVSSDCVNTPEETRNKLIADAMECLKLLKVLDTLNMSVLMKAIQETSVSAQCLAVIKDLSSES